MTSNTDVPEQSELILSVSGDVTEANSILRDSISSSQTFPTLNDSSPEQSRRSSDRDVESTVTSPLSSIASGSEELRAEYDRFTVVSLDNDLSREINSSEAHLGLARKPSGAPQDPQVTSPFPFQEPTATQEDWQTLRPKRVSTRPVRYGQTPPRSVTNPIDTLTEDERLSTAKNKRPRPRTNATALPNKKSKRGVPDSESQQQGTSTTTHTPAPARRSRGRPKKQPAVEAPDRTRHSSQKAFVIKLKVKPHLLVQFRAGPIIYPGTPQRTKPPPSRETDDQDISQPQPTTPVVHVRKSSNHEEMLALSKQLTVRTKIEDKPQPRGQPAVWAADRQALCETTMYYRSHQGSCYMNGGLVYAMMFDENSHERDFMDADVIVSRAGGCMARNAEGEMVQVKAQADNAQTRSFQNNLLQQIPIVVICGNKNSACPSQMLRRYSVLGFFKVTDIVPSKGHKSRLDMLQYRLEKLDSTRDGWWKPRDVEPVLRLGELPPPEQLTCIACKETHEQVYMVWVCLTRTCSLYWKRFDGTILAPNDVAFFNPAWLKKLTKWKVEEDPFELAPASEATLKLSHPHSSTKGLSCPRCGMCISRYRYIGYMCDNEACDFLYNPEPLPTPIQALRDPSKLVGKGSPISYDRMESYIKSWHSFKLNHRINYFGIPGLDNNIIVHMIGNQRCLEEPRGPDAMFAAMQAEDIGLERRFMVTGKAFGRMSAFSVNHGYPYKFVGTVPSRLFKNAPWVITETRTQLNYFSKLVLNEKFPERAFNELLTFAYLEGQKIKYHDDGETGLGPTVATYSLGAPATMRFRLKGKYYTGVVMKTMDGREVKDDHDDDDVNDDGVETAEALKVKTAKKDKQKVAYFLAEAPLPNTLKYDERKKAYESLRGLSVEQQDQRCRALPSELGLRYRKGSPPLISIHLAHGDKIIMHGEAIQKYFEHEVEPAKGHGVRFANTCREILEHHLPVNARPLPEDVPADTGIYNGENLI